MKSAIAASGLALLATPAFAQGSTLTIYADCRLPTGEIAYMSTYTEVYNDTGVAYGPGVDPDIIGVIRSGSVTTYHQGVLRTSSGDFSFTGENKFIQFGHRGAVYEVVWYSASRYGLRDSAYGAPTHEIPCVIQSML